MRIEIDVPESIVHALPPGAHGEHMLRTSLIAALSANLASPPPMEDPLTGVFSMRRLKDDVWAAMYETRTCGEPFRARYLCLNVSGMKRYIDQHGLVAADELFCTGAKRVQAAYPSSRVYRVTGDGFAVELAPDEPIKKVDLPDGQAFRTSTANFVIGGLDQLERKEMTWSQALARLVYASDTAAVPEHVDLRFEWTAPNAPRTWTTLAVVP